MTTLIIVHPTFDATWPFAADHLAKLCQPHVELTFIRTHDDEDRPLHQIVNPLGLEHITQLIALSIKVMPDCLAHMPMLKEAAILGPYSPDNDPALNAALQAKGVRVYAQQSEGCGRSIGSQPGTSRNTSAARCISSTSRTSPMSRKFCPRS